MNASGAFNCADDGRKRRRGRRAWMQRIALCALASSMSVSCFTAARPQSGTTAALGRLLQDPNVARHPRRPLDLIKNLEIIASSRVLLADDFYTTENLLYFLGGTLVTWGENTHLKRSGDISDPSTMLPDTRFAWPSVRFRLRRSADQKTSNARLSLYAVQAVSPDLKFEAIVDVFGTEWQDWPRRLLTPHGQLPPRASHQMGNKAILYRDFAGNKQTAIVLYWYPDGTLDSLIIGQGD